MRNSRELHLNSSLWNGLCSLSEAEIDAPRLPLRRRQPLRQEEDRVIMEMVKEIDSSQWWWLDSQNRPKSSPWLHSTLSDLDRKTKAMLKLIEQDADSFAKRAEMYYQRRPELISMVEDLYRAYRSLAERHDQLKSDTGSRVSTTYGSPFSSFKYRSEKSSTMSDHTSDICSESFDTEDYAESEVEDPEQDEKTQAKTETKEAESPNKGKEIVEVGDSEDEDGTLDQGTEEVFDQVFGTEVMKLKDEVERLKEENNVQKAQLMEISDLCNFEVTKLRLQVERLKEENKVQKAQLMERNKENNKLLSELCNGEAMELRVEVERLMEENKTLKAQLMEEKETSRILSELCNDEVKKMKAEVERLMEENETQKVQLMEGDILSELCNDEVSKMRVEIERLMGENETQKAQEEEKSQLLIVCSDEVTKLREQVERLKEEQRMHEAELMQKGEEKREVIRQLTLAIQVYRDRNTELRKSIITKDSPKKWSPFDFNKLNGRFFGKLLTGPPKFQATVVAL